MPCGPADSLKFLLYRAHRLAQTSPFQCLTDPFRKGHVSGTSGALNFPVLGILQDDLKAFSHAMSLYDSS